MKENTNLDVLVISLKSGEYDGTSIMQAWTAIERLMKIEKELTTLKASIPKIKADAVLSLIEAIEGAIDNDFISIKEVEEMHLEDFCGLAKRHANKLEAGE